MCKSQADGGQRCPKEARIALRTAEQALTAARKAALDAAMGAGRDDRGAFTTPADLADACTAAAAAVHVAEVALASTPTGRRELVTKIAEFASNPTRDTFAGKVVVADWATTIAKGDALRAENQEVAQQVRFNRHPTWPDAERQIARTTADGYGGWVGVNRTLRRMGITNVTQDRYLANLVAEKFGFGKNAYGKAPRPAATANPVIPARTTPAPITADEFDRQYLPERGHHPDRPESAWRDVPDVPDPTEARHWWVAYDDADGERYYQAGTITHGQSHAGWVRTTIPWTTGKETVHVADERHLDYHPDTLRQPANT